MPDDDKPKRSKSWREIDKMRDKSGGGARKADDRERENFEKSTGYTKYKTNLERLFSGGMSLPEHLRDPGDSQGQATSEEDEARKKLYAIEDQKKFFETATEFLKTYPLPDDARLLDRLLMHPDEDIVDQALSRLEAMHKAGTLKVPPALVNRLATVEVDSGTPSVRRRAAELRKAIR